MRTIKMVSGCIVAGHGGVDTGAVLDLDDGEASLLVSMGKAKYHGSIETREPMIENRDPEFAPQTQEPTILEKIKGLKKPLRKPAAPPAPKSTAQ